MPFSVRGINEAVQNKFGLMMGLIGNILEGRSINYKISTGKKVKFLASSKHKNKMDKFPIATVNKSINKYCGF